MQNSNVAWLIIKSIASGQYRSGLLTALHYSMFAGLIFSLAYKSALISVLTGFISMLLLIVVLFLSYLEKKQRGIVFLSWFSINGGKPIELYDHAGKISYSMAYNNYSDAPVIWLRDIKNIKLNSDSTVSNMDGSPTYIKYWLPIDKNDRFAKIMQNDLYDIEDLAKNLAIK